MRSASGRNWWPLAAVCLLVVLGVQILRLRFLSVRRFDPDEFQHLHIAWCIARGQLPYRDFFDHHLPLFHLLLAPFFAFFRVDESFRDASAFLFLARRVSWLLSGVSIALTFLVGRAWRGTAVGLMAIGLLATTRTFVDKGTEVRPDVLALALLLGSVFFLLREAASSSPPQSLPGPDHLALSGLLFGAGLVTSPKLIFAAPVFLVPILLGPAGRRSRSLLVFSAVVAVPVASVLVYLAPGGDLGPFLLYAVEWNARWRTHFSPWGSLVRVAQQSPLLCLAGLIGFLVCAAQWLLTGERRRSDLVLLLAASCVSAGLFLNPVPFPSSFLPLFPFLAVFAGSAWVGLASKLRGDRVGPVVLAAALALVSVQPLLLLQSIDKYKNTQQLEDLRWVMENTQPSDRVLDSWTGAGVFRLHAWFFFCLPEDVLAMIGPNERHQLLRDLRSGSIRPRLIVSEDALRSVSPRLGAFVERHYHRARGTSFWRREPR